MWLKKLHSTYPDQQCGFFENFRKFVFSEFEQKFLTGVKAAFYMYRGAYFATLFLKIYDFSGLVSEVFFTIPHNFNLAL